MTIKSRFSLSLFLVLAAVQVQVQVQAAEIYTTVFNVIESKNTEKVLLVLSGADGRIYRAPKTEANVKLLKSLTGQFVKLSFADNKNITNVRSVYPGEVDPSTEDLNHFRYNELRQFAPTELQSKEEATELFNSMINDGDRKRSQCFKRAHIWSYDLWSNLGINSQKIFIFYTPRYSIIEDFDWWFHVAPLVNVKGEDFVMDGTFMQKPVTVTEWKNFFVKSPKVNCGTMEHYSEYKNNQWSRLCYLMKTPMYILSPLDIENRDFNGIEKNHWILDELQDARRAFKNFQDAYEGLDSGKPTKTY